MKNNKLKLLAFLTSFTILLSGCELHQQKGGFDVPGSKEGQILVQFTGFNDFHAHIHERGDDVGLARFSTYIKKRKKEGSIIINSGDIWKGEYIDSYTRGGLMSQAMREMGVDVNTLGNHEFDWGPEYIIRNQKPEYLNDYFLGANIVKYPSKENASELCRPYKIITKNKGTEDEVKIGVIGAIGKKQFTSITSTSVKDYDFLDQTTCIKKYSTILRKDENCDLVILSLHDGDFNYQLAEIDSDTNMPYVDAAFLGHTHQLMNGKYGNTPFIQSQCFGSYVGEVCFYVDKKSREPSLEKCENINLKDMRSKLDRDPKIVEMVDKIAKGENGTDKIESEVLGTSDGLSTEASARMYATYSAKKIQEISEERNYPEIAMAMFNHSREPIKSGEITYGDLFFSNPFQNTLYIINVTGINIINQAGRSSCWYRVTDKKIENSREAKYNILVYSYNGLHQDNYRNYNYFPSLEEDSIIKVEGNEDGLNAVDIVASYMRSGELPSLNSSDYSTSNPRYNERMLYEDLA